MAIANEYCQNFSVGDIVTVREWEDMEKEFGLDIDGDIPLLGTYFTECMIGYCGVDCRIVDIDDIGYYTIESVNTEHRTRLNYRAWSFEDKMLYEKDDENSVVGKELSEFLLSIMK